MPILPAVKQKEKIPPLLYPPLIESIFELHWKLQEDKASGRFFDPSYPMMYGRIYERLKKDFPHIEDLPAVNVHPEASPYVVRHRIRKEKNGYPLLQIGPGIATANYAQGYSWRGFKGHILHLAEAISQLYPTAGSALQFTKCEIRFLNGIRLGEKESPLGFLTEKLHMKVDLDSDLFLMNQIVDPPNAVNVNLGYPLKKPNGNLGISAHLGQMEGKQAYLFQIQVVSGEGQVPATPQGFESWVSDAHGVAVNAFATLCKGPLIAKFCGG